MRPSSENIARRTGCRRFRGRPSVLSDRRTRASGGSRPPGIAACCSERVEALTLRRGEDEVQDAALLRGELGFDQVCRLLRVQTGMLNSSFRLPPTVATRTIRGATMPSQLRTTRPGCVAHARIQPASAPVDRRWCAARRRSASQGLLSLPCSVMAQVPSCRFQLLDCGRAIDVRTHRTAFAFPTTLRRYGRAMGPTSHLRRRLERVTLSGDRPVHHVFTNGISPRRADVEARGDAPASHEPW